MLGMGWLTLRQARAALQNGRLEEAQQLLGQPSARGHKKSWALLELLTRGYVARGERHLKQQNLAGHGVLVGGVRQIGVAGLRIPILAALALSDRVVSEHDKSGVDHVEIGELILLVHAPEGIVAAR